MPTNLKLTLATGETPEIPFTQQSTVSIKTQVAGDNGGLVDKEFAYSGVVAFEIVDVASGDAALAADTTPGMETPEAAIHFALVMPLADAGAHIEKAIAKFGDHDLLVELASDIDRAVRAGDETFTTNVTVPEPDDELPVSTINATEAAVVFAKEHNVDVAAVTGTGSEGRITKDDVEHFVALTTTIAEINKAQSVEDAQTATAAALEKWPENEQLLALKTRADELAGPPKA